MTETRAGLLQEIKMRGSATHAELADALDMTGEAVRQHLAVLVDQGLLVSERVARAGRGRPALAYRLTDAGEERFPRFYDALTLTLMRTLGERFGEDGLRAVLADITDRQVAEWQPKLDDKTLEQRIDALRGLYFDEDPFTEVQRDDDGAMLVEHNCPYLAAAVDEPRLCSVTLSTMKRLLGVEVERTERFQHGDGRCVFRIRHREPVDAAFRFDLEPGRSGHGRSD